MELIDYDVRDRKSLARAARYKKNGSKSKKCMLPSDRLTDAQIRKRNGGLKVYQIGKPITWAEFTRYPVEMQKEYLEHFAQKHRCNAPMLARMMGISAATIRTYTCRVGLSGIIVRHPTYEEQKAFYEWLESQKEPERVVEKVEENQAPAAQPVKVEKPVTARSTIMGGSCTLQGTANEILLELQQMLKNENVVMSVTWHRAEENNADVG